MLYVFGCHILREVDGVKIRKVVYSFYHLLKLNMCHEAGFDMLDKYIRKQQVAVVVNNERNKNHWRRFTVRKLRSCFSKCALSRFIIPRDVFILLRSNAPVNS